MTLPMSLVRRLLHACERGYNWTEMASHGEQDHRARVDKRTIENTLAAVRREIASQQRPVGRNRIARAH